MSATGRADPLEMATAYQRSALVAAACETGIADALVAGEGDPRRLASSLGLDPRGTRALLGAMVATGLATRAADGGYALTAAGAPLARSHPESVADIVAKESYFYSAWAGLADTIRSGHARIRPWRERLATDTAASLAFLGALDDLGRMFGGGLPRLAGVGPGRLLDVGGGSGVHAAALAREVEGLDATVLDLAPVGALVRERHPELTFVAGDLSVPRFGRPAGEEWDAVLLANVLHDHPAAKAARIVAEAAGLLATGGTLVVYEWLLNEDGDGPPDVAMFALMMMVENEGGAAWTADQVEGWLREAGLTSVETRRSGGPIAVVRGRRG